VLSHSSPRCPLALIASAGGDIKSSLGVGLGAKRSYTAAGTEPTGGLYLNGVNERKSYAAFGYVSYQFGDKWKVEGGVRETWARDVNNYVPCPATVISSTCYLGDANAFHFLNPNPNDPWGPLVFNGSGFQNLGLPWAKTTP
jgi:hypothetical protein